MRIAIIGGGAAGLGAAWALSPDHDVTLFEKSDRFGGHAETHDINYDGKRITVDSGFMIHNPRNYPNLTTLFGELGVRSQPADMSVSVTGATEIEWSSNAQQIIASLAAFNLNLKFFPLLLEIRRFNTEAKQRLNVGDIPDVTIADYLEQQRHSKTLLNCYLIPIVTAIWSMPANAVLEFPAPMLIRFFHNHSLLDFGRAPWQTVVGGTKTYVERLIARTRADFRIGESVQSVTRNAAGVMITTNKNPALAFDHVVLACHPDQAVRMLNQPTPREQNLLAQIPYTESRTVLHRDETQMPKDKRRWASWNCIVPTAPGPQPETFSITYNMNKIQRIDPARPVFVSLRPHREIRADKIFAEMTYHHPLYSAGMLRACAGLQSIQGENRTSFAGAYLGSGFHEDAFSSGLAVADHLCRRKDAETSAPQLQTIQ